LVLRKYCAINIFEYLCFFDDLWHVPVLPYTTIHELDMCSGCNSISSW